MRQNYRKLLISFLPMTHTYIHMLHLLKTGSLDNAIQDLLLASSGLSFDHRFLPKIDARASKTSLTRVNRND